MLESYGLLWYNKEQQVVLGKNIFRLSSRTARSPLVFFRCEIPSTRKKLFFGKLDGLIAHITLFFFSERIYIK